MKPKIKSKNLFLATIESMWRLSKELETKIEKAIIVTFYSLYAQL